MAAAAAAAKLVVIVAGASRGAGKGIALAFADAGATVYVVGRSSRKSKADDAADAAAAAAGASGGGTRTIGGPNSFAGTVDDTADAVTHRGGVGIAVTMDATKENDAVALVQRVRDEAGRLDVLVNAVWGGNERMTATGFVDSAADGSDKPVTWGEGFWRFQSAVWRDTMRAGPFAYFNMARAAAPLLIETASKARAGGATGATLIFNVTEPPTPYTGNLFWDVSHATIDRLSFTMASDLAKHGVASVACAPGFMKTERVLASLAEMEGPPPDTPTETTEYIGRAAVALSKELAAGGDRRAAVLKLGQTDKPVTVHSLAQRYGFTDVDGTQPKWEFPAGGMDGTGAGAGAGADADASDDGGDAKEGAHATE